MESRRICVRISEKHMEFLKNLIDGENIRSLSEAVRACIEYTMDDFIEYEW